MASVYAGVAVLTALPEQLDYLVPAELIGVVRPGVMVAVPLQSRRVAGVVVEVRDTTALDPARVKRIASVLDDGAVWLTPGLMSLAREMAAYYFCPLPLTIKTMIPTSPRPEDQIPRERVLKYRVKIAPEQRGDLRRAPKQRALYEAIIAGQELVSGEEVAVARELQKRGLVDLIPDSGPVPLPVEAWPPLTSEQEQALSAARDCESKGERIILLHGVTGSGKTELYMRWIKECLAAGKQAIVLVPEISLTPQLIGRFTSRFGGDVAVLHSALGTGERLRTWQDIARGKARIVIGPRSAVFAPCHNLGIIVMDEEHDPAYKQDDNPRYHTRTVAQLRAKIENARLVLGSATPALETFTASEQGRCTRITLKERVFGQPLPDVQVIDMREEIRQGQRGLLSRRLRAALEERLARGEQSIIFYNRRGFAHTLVCENCGGSPACPHCSVNLSWHKREGVLKCHYCGYTIPYRASCPECGAPYQDVGAGTEQVVEAVELAVPEARVLRMDSDTTSRKGAHAELLGAFQAGGADVLVGTQIIAKGLDLPRVTLVGVVSADTDLLLPDYRAAEHTFSLLMQVAGRAGRSTLGGEVIVQSFNPDHYAIQTVIHHNYEQFYRTEMRNREAAGYPPAGALTELLFLGTDETRVAQSAARMATCLKERASGRPFSIIGPSPALQRRINDNFRWSLSIKAHSRGIVRDIVGLALEAYNTDKDRQVKVLLNLDA
jgi:primosomal protein N' (replication factor Y)